MSAVYPRVTKEAFEALVEESQLAGKVLTDALAEIGRSKGDSMSQGGDGLSRAVEDAAKARLANEKANLKMTMAVPVEPPSSCAVVAIGTYVTIEDSGAVVKRFIAGEVLPPKLKDVNGVMPLATNSSLGGALEGHTIDETVIVLSNKGPSRQVKILKIEILPA